MRMYSKNGLSQKNKIWKISKFETFENQFLVFWKSKFSIKISKNDPHQNLKSDGNLDCIVTSCWYSPEIKLQYMKNTLHVPHFHINMVLSTRNMFKQAKVIKSRGALGTGFTYAPVRQSCGKPSPRFPHGGLVECFTIHTILNIYCSELLIFDFSIFSL